MSRCRSVTTRSVGGGRWCSDRLVEAPRAITALCTLSTSPPIAASAGLLAFEIETHWDCISFLLHSGRLNRVPLLGPVGADFEHMPQQLGFASGAEISPWQQGRCCDSDPQPIQQHFWQAQAKRGVAAKTVAAAVTQTSNDRSAFRSRRIIGPV